MPKKVKIDFDGWCCGYYDKKSNNWQIMFDGAIFEGSYPTDFVNKINELTSTNLYEKGTVYHVFINCFDQLSELFKGDFKGKYQQRFQNPDGSISIREAFWQKVYNPNSKITIKYKDFTCFAPKAFKLNSVTNMIDFFNCDLLKNLTPANYKYSFGYVVKSFIFYTPEMREELSNYMKANHINYWCNDKDGYHRVCGCCKSGLLMRKIEEFDNDRFDGNEFDARSMYSSVMMTDDHYPTSKVCEIEGIFARRAFDNCVNNPELRWFKIYIPNKYDEIIPPAIYQMCRDRKTGDFFIDCEHYQQLVNREHLLDINWFYDILTKDGVYFMESYCGFLQKCVRNRLAHFYDLKEKLKGFDENSRSVVKMVLELMYGKGLQDRCNEELDSLRARQLDGSNYITPWMSGHTVAVAQCRLRNIIINNPDKIKYFDTDSVHGLGLDDYINKMNKKIQAHNTAVGIDNDCGTFKKEFEEDVTEIVFAPKQRIIITADNKAVCKVAGVPLDQIEAYVKKYYDRNLSREKIIEKIYIDQLNSLEITLYKFDKDKGYTPFTDKYKNVKEFVTNADKCRSRNKTKEKEGQT